MAVTSYTVQSGDTLWGICGTYASSISGNGTWAKIETLMKINKSIKSNYIIYVGQVIKFSEGSGSDSESSTIPTKATIDAFGLRSDDDSGRAMYANWTWTRENTKGYKYRWTQHLNGKWVVGNEGSIDIPEDTPKENFGEYCQSEYSADASAKKVRFQVLPVAKTRKSGDNEIPYWTDAKWSDVKEYDFADSPPMPPGAPSVEIDESDDRKLVISIDNIDASKLNAKYVKFNIVKNNAASVHTSGNVTINTVANHVQYEFAVDYGAEYKVRACSISAKGKESGWSEFSSNVATKPSAPSGITVCRTKKRPDGSISVYLEWSAVKTATSYRIEYTTNREDFETAPGEIKTFDTDDARTAVEVTGIESGYDYFFRVRAVRDSGASEPTDIVTIPVGEPPAAPTTWSSTNSAFVGDALELSWTHNSRDGSSQTYAQLSMKINNGIWHTFTFENTTNDTTGERTDVSDFSYGQAVSYKGSLFVKMDTNNAALKDAEIQWKVRTAGVTDAFSDTDWSIERTLYVYARPNLLLSVTSDLAGQSMVEPLTAFPFYIRGEVELDSYERQRPIGYHLQVLANNFYETIDDAGKTKTVSPGDAVYSKYFDTSEILVVEMSANNIDLETGMKYTVTCTADMSTGLSVSQTHDFDVGWTDVPYVIRANVGVNTDSYTAVISPYCEDIEHGDLVENVTLSVYRREYDGSLTEIGKNIPNNGTSVTDPHPALDYARYRLIAKDTKTGAISFYDMPGVPIKCTSVVIQWDEEWSPFETSDELIAGVPQWSGSMLVLPYNVSVSDSRKREVTTVHYAGREYPITYFGTKIDETSSWSTTIPKRDTDTIYALRRLSLWSGNAYVREPSGMGFWAIVVPSFSIGYDSVTVEVTLDITRVEGGA